jgi:hypothetical protein
MVDQYLLSLPVCSCTFLNLRVFITLSSGGFVACLPLLRKITSLIFLAFISWSLDSYFPNYKSFHNHFATPVAQVNQCLQTEIYT